LEANKNIDLSQSQGKHDDVRDAEYIQGPEQDSVETISPETPERFGGIGPNPTTIIANAQEQAVHNASNGLENLDKQDAISSVFFTQKDQILRQIDRSLTPDEVNTIVTSRMVQKRPWRDVFRSLPERRVGHVKYWYYTFCVGFQTNPPQNSSPWTVEERTKLNSVKSQSHMSWTEMQSMFQDRDIAELQYEWIRTCAGEAAWQNRKHHQGEKPSQLGTPSKQPDSASRIWTPSRSLSSLQTKSLMQPGLKRSEDQGRGSGSESSDGIDPLTEAFDKAWTGSGLSTIQIDTPPKESTSKKQTLAKVGVSPLAIRSGRKQTHLQP
jgi:hypothetical protein